MPHPDPPEVTDLFHRELGLVGALARILCGELGRTVEEKELQSFGMEGLLFAARRYEPDSGVPFRKFAHYRVKGAMLDGIRAHSSFGRRGYEKARAIHSAHLVAAGFFDESHPQETSNLSPEDADKRLTDQLSVLATAMALGLSGRDEDIQGERYTVDDNTPDQELERKELYRLVNRILPTLPADERELVRRHFFHDEDITDIAASMGRSKSWGSRVLARALSNLSWRLQAAMAG